MHKSINHAVLIVGDLHERVEQRLQGRVDAIKMLRADPASVTPDLQKRVTAIGCLGPVSAKLIDALPNLEIIASFGVGYDMIDIVHARSKGIIITNTPDVLNEEVADATIGLLINTVRQFPKAETWLRAGHWKEGPYPLSVNTMRNRKIGIYGLGRIGKAIGRRLEGFGLPINYHNRHPVADSAYQYHSTLHSLAMAVDTLICAVPGNAATDGSINADILRALGPTGVLINIGRGKTVDQDALLFCLENKIISAAGLDVFANEPYLSDEMLMLENTSLLPHIASASANARHAVANLVADNLLSWIETGKALTPIE